MQKYKRFKDFYPYYLKEHSHKHTKLLHFIGTTFSLYFLVLMFINFELIYLVYSLISGYGFAWLAHFFIEKNKPATFTYPFFSLLSDYIMFWEILRGKHKIF